MSKVMKVDKAGRLVLSEAEISQQHRDFLEQHGWQVHPLHAERNFRQARDRRERTGCADYVCISPYSGAFYLEMKRKRGKLRPSQIEFQTEVMRKGFTYVVSEDFDEFTKWYFSYVDDYHA